jgi:hypothetical protein
MALQERNRASDGHDTVERLRRDIDHGRTGDKVRVTDPAAAPLGADEEAAGTPLPRAAVAQARTQELNRSADPQKRREGRDISHWLFIGAIVLVAAALVFWAMR